MVETETQECMSRFLRWPAAGMQRMERRFLALEETNRNHLLATTDGLQISLRGSTRGH